MSAPLLTASQLASLQTVAESGMQTTAIISRLTTADSVYGDDDTVTFTYVATVKCWIFSRPTPEASIDSGSLMTSNTYRAFFPVGTDLLTRDQVQIGPDLYTVSDTTFESTWLPLMTASLRKRE